jgi:hypothetical protein
MNVMSWANLCGVEHDPQQTEGVMMLRRIVCSMLVLFAATAQGQIRRQPQNINTDPDYWVGLTLGYMEGVTLSDDETGSTWAFGYSTQLRATLEKAIGRGATVGVSAGFSSVPLTYQSGNFGSVCGQCRADANINQYTAFVRVGGGPGFHGMYQFEGGVTQFTNFREHDSQTRLAPTDGAYDATVGFGGGIAYGLSRTSDIYATETLDFVFHRQNTAVQQQAPRFFTFRGGFRFGF